jgi:hypothetical protein
MLRDFSKEEFDIILQAGQSNSEGCGLGKATQPFVQREDILYFNNDFTISMAQERVWANDVVAEFSLSFCTRYIEDNRLQSGRKLLVVRAAIGGTGFLDNRWGMNDDLFLRMMEMTKTALELNPKNKLVAFLWHQGETDACLNADKATHFKNLSTLINAVKTKFNSPNLPFIAGDFVKHWKMDNIGICTPVIDAMKEVCETIGNAKFVYTDDLQSNDQVLHNEDTIHFCRESINELGLKYYKAYTEIIS